MANVHETITGIDTYQDLLPDFSRIRVAQCLVLCVVFCWPLFVLCVACLSINGVWLPLWYLQTFV